MLGLDTRVGCPLMFKKLLHNWFLILIVLMALALPVGVIAMSSQEENDSSPATPATVAATPTSQPPQETQQSTSQESGGGSGGSSGGSSQKCSNYNERIAMQQRAYQTALGEADRINQNHIANIPYDKNDPKYAQAIADARLKDAQFRQQLLSSYNSGIAETNAQCL